MNRFLNIAVFSLFLLASGAAHAEGQRRNQSAEPSLNDKAYPLIMTNTDDGSVLSEGKNNEGVPVPVSVGTRRNDDGSYTRTVTDVDGKTHTSTYSR